MRNWEKILSEQLLPDAKRLSVEDATILYEDADINDLMFVSLERKFMGKLFLGMCSEMLRRFTKIPITSKNLG